MALPLLFHKDVFLPEFSKKPVYAGPLHYSQHARNVAQEGGGHGAIELPATLNSKEAVLVEVELDNRTGSVQKQVWRQPLNEEWDLCFPLIPGGVVKTVWLNHRTDTHKTLDKTKFVSGYQWRGMKNKFSDAKT